MKGAGLHRLTAPPEINMKILICSPGYPPDVRGGGEISTQLLCRGLRLRGLEVEVLAAHRETRLDHVDGIPVHRVKSPNLYWSFDSREKSRVERAVWHLREGYDWRLPASYAEVIARTKPDVLHTSGIEDISPKIWKLARKMGIPVVHTIRSYTLLCPSATLRRGETNCTSLCRSCLIAALPKRTFSRHVNAVIGISDYVLQRHLNHGFFPEADRHVIPNIADDETCDTATRPRDGQSVVGFLGRLSPEKGLERIFAALHLLPPSARPPLLVAGWGAKDYEHSLEKAAHGLDVRFLGKIKPAELFSRIDLLVIPSLWHEPLGRIVLEANSFGLPVLAARRGGIPEIVFPGKTGWLFEPDDTDGLAGLIGNTCANASRLRAMASDCRAAAIAYSSETIANRHIEVYERVLPASRENVGRDLAGV